ncbi:hypothetical protein [Nocardioides sp. Root140]|uniref:hypothetical protein n=1 Tax=Nocardioides sp. Root140 TaxID=1736460 RepID=UPI0006F460AD|nr:hypothetical protein [Nocardioides sp. Root140]KQY55426.1 hypothetical protein ASD30_16085 [Nocardioides sp. Root140]
MSIAKRLGGALLLLTAGCAVETQPEVPDVAMSFVQQRVFEGTPRAQLRVVNSSSDDLTVTGVGLDWPGYGKFLDDYSTTVEAGRTLDLNITLPTPDCSALAPTSKPVIGRVRVGNDVVRRTLDASGTGFVTRIWQRECDERRVESAVRLSYDGPRQLVGSGRRTQLAGHITLTRRSEERRIVVPEIVGSVLLELHLDQPAVLPPGVDRRTFPMTMVVPRCDVHALIESSQTFHFLMAARLGDDPLVRVLRLPDVRTRARAQALLDQACR